MHRIPTRMVAHHVAESIAPDFLGFTQVHDKSLQKSFLDILASNLQLSEILSENFMRSIFLIFRPEQEVAPKLSVQV